MIVKTGDTISVKAIVTGETDDRNIHCRIGGVNVILDTGSDMIDRVITHNFQPGDHVTYRRHGHELSPYVIHAVSEKAAWITSPDYDDDLAPLHTLTRRTPTL